MRLFLLLFLLAACAACSRSPAPPGPAGTAFTKAAATAGERHVTTAELGLDAPTASRTPNGLRERTTDTEEVLAVDRGVATRKRVTREAPGQPPESTIVEGPAAADPITAALPDAPVAPGQDMPGLARAIGERLKGLAVTDARVTFTRAAGDDAVFDVAMKLSRTEERIAMTMDLKGTLHVATTTGAPTSMRLSGPVTFAGGSGTVTFALERR
jgi:hypothetical protein